VSRCLISPLVYYCPPLPDATMPPFFFDATAPGAAAGVCFAATLASAKMMPPLPIPMSFVDVAAHVIFPV